MKLEKIHNPMSGSTLTVTIKISKIWRVRAWFAMKIFKLAGFVLGTSYTDVNFVFDGDKNEAR